MCSELLAGGPHTTRPSALKRPSVNLLRLLDGEAAWQRCLQWIGQRSLVRVRSYYVEGTVEERIVEERRRGASGEAAGAGALTGGSGDDSRGLTPARVKRILGVYG